MKTKKLVLAALAQLFLLLIGCAPLTSFAAVTWQEEDGTWRCYEKDGTPVTGRWERDGDSYYYLDQDGRMAADTLVEYDGDYYYVDADGVRATKHWVCFPNEFDLWDEDVEHVWYYFGEQGKAVRDRMKTVDGKKYLFDEEGRMMTGWQRWGGDEDLYYLGTCDEGWVHTGWQSLEPWDEMIGDYEAEEWFYFRPVSGKAYRDVRKRINGGYYEFDENGVMEDRWRIATPSNAVASPGYTVASPGCTVASPGCTVASPGYAQPSWFDEDTGTAGKGWIYAYNPEDVDETGEEHWYYLDSQGVPFNFGGKDANSPSFAHHVLDNYFYQNCAAKVIGGKTYLFNDKGQMLAGYFSLYNVRREGGSTLGGYEWEYYYFYNRETGKGRMMTGKQTVYDDDGNERGHVHLKNNGTAYTTYIVGGRLYDPTGFRFEADGVPYEILYLKNMQFKIKGSSQILTDCLIIVDDSGRVKKSGTITFDGYRFTVKDYILTNYEAID